MKKALLIFLTLSMLSATAQDHLLGGYAGVNVANANATQLNTDPTNGFTAGLTYEYLVTPHFSIAVDVSYIQRGFKDFIIYASFLESILTWEEVNNKYNYISLPLKAGFTTGEAFYGFVNAGIIPALLVSAKAVGPGLFGTGTETYNTYENVTKFDFAALAEIGAGYKFEERFRLFASISYQHSFTTVSRYEYYSNEKITHYGIAFVVGVKCMLKKD